MRHQDLTNHIKGSFLKQQYLEAFLVQSAYIESLLRLFADFKFWEIFKDKIKAAQSNPITVELRRNISKDSLAGLITFLHRTKLITDDQKRIINKYKERRNIVLHDLLSEIGKNNFEEELKAVCEIGTKITEDKDFIRMAEIVEEIEKLKDEKTIETEQTKSLDTETSLKNILI